MHSGKKLISQAQVVVGENQGTTLLTCDHLTGSVDMDFTCILRGEGLDFSQAKLLRRTRDDGSLVNMTKNIGAGLLQHHSFANPGNYSIKAELYLGERYILQQLVLSVEGISRCQASTNACDLDKDSIPDSCDSDIDGDGITNIVGIVTKDLANCNFSLENIDLQKSRDQASAIAKGVS